MAEHDNPLAIARDILNAERDCSVCGGDGLQFGTPGTKCVCCRGERKLKVYGPNVRVLAEAFTENAPPANSWKVVGRDNFNREHVSDTLAADSIGSEKTAKVLADALNAEYGGDQAPRFYVAKPSSYQLYRFEP